MNSSIATLPRSKTNGRRPGGWGTDLYRCTRLLNFPMPIVCSSESQLQVEAGGHAKVHHIPPGA